MSSTNYDSAIIGISINARPPFWICSAAGPPCPSAGISWFRLGYRYRRVSGPVAVCRRGGHLSPAPPVEFTSKSGGNYSAECK